MTSTVSSVRGSSLPVWCSARRDARVVLGGYAREVDGGGCWLRLVRAKTPPWDDPGATPRQATAPALARTDDTGEWSVLDAQSRSQPGTEPGAVARSSHSLTT